MNKLERLAQDEDGILRQANGKVLSPEYAVPKGKIRTLVIANPCLDISKAIDKMTERKSVLIPNGANAYVTSDFSGETQHIRKSDSEKNGKNYSVFAVQFYYACNFLPLLDK